MIKTIIVENEMPHFLVLEKQIKENFPEVDIMLHCETIPDAIEMVTRLKPDLILLDIDLPPQTGFDLLEATKGMSYQFIFTTSYNDYAIKAFKYSAVHYLLKPCSVDDLKEALDYYKERVGYHDNNQDSIDTLFHNLKEKEMKLRKIGIPVEGGIEYIQTEDIIYCQAQSNYADLYLVKKNDEKRERGKKITLTKTLKWLENLLKESSFVRTHNSYLVNIDHVKKFDRGGKNGGDSVILTGNHVAEVSRGKKNNLLKHLGQ